MNRERLTILRDALRTYHFDEKLRFNMGTWHETIAEQDEDYRPCGTVCCAAGLTPHIPQFKDLVQIITPRDRPKYKNHEYFSWFTFCRDFYGVTGEEYEELFLFENDVPPVGFICDITPQMVADKIDEMLSREIV